MHNENIILKKIDNLEKNVSTLKEDVSNLKEDVSTLKEGQKKLENGQEKLINKFFNLEDQIKTSNEEMKKYRNEMVGIMENIMSELQVKREEQTAHVGSHERIDSDHIELKEQVQSHEIRIKVLEPA